MYYKRYLVALFLFLLVIPRFVNLYSSIDNIHTNKLPAPVVQDFFKQSFHSDFIPPAFRYNTRNFNLSLTLNRPLEDQIKSVIGRYRPDHVAVAVVDNNNGEILAALGYERATNRFGRALVFDNNHPAASIVKMITAADLLERGAAHPDSEFEFTGRTTTLYKYQIRDEVNPRWSRTQDLKKAFASSNNVIFARAAIENNASETLPEMATRFGFGERLISEVDCSASEISTIESDSDYSLAEVASGFNVRTTLSPLHAALLPMIVVNKGIMRYPTLLRSIQDDDGSSVWTPSYKWKRVISRKTADDLEVLMKQTIVDGTARTSFRSLVRKSLFDDLVIGGKTGSITGGEPYGRHDWFVSFAYPANNPADKGISVAVMIINERKWYTKSAYLAKEIIDYYFSAVNKIN